MRVTQKNLFRCDVCSTEFEFPTGRAPSQIMIVVKQTTGEDTALGGNDVTYADLCDTCARRAEAWIRGDMVMVED